MEHGPAYPMNDTPSPSSTSPETADSAAKPPAARFNFWRWFWLSTIPVSIIWVWHDFYVPANHVTWARDYASASQQAAREGKPVILFFTGVWCVPCRIMKRTVWADKEVEAVVRAGFTPVMIDLVDPKEAGTVSQFSVFSTPTTIIIDPPGTILKRVQGGIGKTAFLELLGTLKRGVSPGGIPPTK